jgi:hypothetical protein
MPLTMFGAVGFVGPYAPPYQRTAHHQWVPLMLN